VRRSLGRTFVRNQLLNEPQNQDSFLTRLLYETPHEKLSTVPAADSKADSEIVNGFEELRDRSMMLGQ
jgi:hypothetical protein